MVPVGKRARVRVGGKVGLQPLHLRGSGTATSHKRTVRVERDHVPASQVVRVESFAGSASRSPEVIKVARGPSRLVLVVAWAWHGARLELAPGGLVTLGEVFGRALRVGVVAQGEHRGAVDALDEPGGRLVVLPGAVGDVARSDDNRWAVDLRGRWLLRATPIRDQDSHGGHHSYPPTGYDTSQPLPVAHGIR